MEYDGITGAGASVSRARGIGAWSARRERRLVRFVRRRRCVWAPSHPRYCSAPHRRQVYADFAAKYASDLTAESVKDRWINIRCTFSSILRKVESSRAENPNKPYKPTWHLWEECQFLLKAKRNNQSSTLQAPQVKEENISDIEEEPVSLLAMPNEASDSASECKDEANSTDSGLACGKIVEGLVSAFRGVQHELFGQEHEEYARVGRMVTKNLSLMNSFEAGFASQRILEILLLYDENNPNNPNNMDDIKNLEM